MNITHSSKLIIKSLLETIVDAEQVSELAKQQFLKYVIDQNIDLRHCFQYISQSNELITQPQISKMLDSHIVQYTKRELDLFFINLSKTTLTYQDLLNFLLPSSVYSLKLISPIQLQPYKRDDSSVSFGYPDLTAIQLMVYVFDKELEIIRKIGSFLESIQERWDLKDQSKILSFVCSKSSSDIKSPHYLTRLLRSLQLDLHPEQLICIIRRLDRDQDGDIGVKDWISFLNPQQNQILKSTQRNRDVSKSPKQRFQSKNKSQNLIKSKLQQQVLPINTQKQKIKEKLKKENNNPNIQTKKLSKQLSNEFVSNEITQKSLQKNVISSPKKTNLVVLNDLAQVLIMITNQLEALEEFKNELSIRADFTIQEAFIYFDLNLDGEIDIEDFRIACFELGVDVSTQDIIYLFGFLGVKDDSLKYNDFHKIFIPKTTTYASILSDRSITNDYDRNRKITFTFETKKQISQLISHLLRSEREIIKFKDQVLNHLYNFIETQLQGSYSLHGARH